MIYVNVNASPNRVESGRSFALNWAEGVSPPDTLQPCTASGAWSGSQTTNGNAVVTAGDPGDALYTLQCGSQQSTAVVQVLPAIDSVSYVPTTADLFELGLVASIAFSLFFGFKQGSTR